MRISDWSSDVCSSDLADAEDRHGAVLDRLERSTRQRSWHGLSFPRLRSTLVRLGHAESAVAGTPGTGGIRERHHRSLRRNDAKPATTNRPLSNDFAAWLWRSLARRKWPTMRQNLADRLRSDTPRGGKTGASTSRYRWWTIHKKK